MRTVRKARTVGGRLRRQLSGAANFDSLPPEEAVAIGYQVVLGRSPDPVGRADYVHRLATGALDRREMVQALWGSEEWIKSSRFSGRMLGYSIHMGRCEFIRSLPRAARIVDLGGTHLHNDMGAMVGLGYPYPFEELVIVDLPADERHAIYRSDEVDREVQTPLGPVRYRYHSMTDLSRFPDASVDLVYSGQSIEHVTPEEGAWVAAEVARILRPGGYFALDTPNSRVTRLQQDEFIDPDHKVEYTLDELVDLLQGAGLQVLETKGLNLALQSLASGVFDSDEVARNSGVYAEAADCYILCALCRRP